MNEQDELLNSQEFAELAHTTQATVRYWVATNYAPPSAKIGRRRVWKKSVVTEWIESKFQEVDRDSAQRKGAS